MLSKEVLEAQETVELPGRDMMNFNISLVGALQGNFSAQGAFVGSANLSSQLNGIGVSQSN